MSMVGPPADVTDIVAHVVAAMVRRNSPRVVVTFVDACVHVIFSISHCAAPATVRSQSKSLDAICIGQLSWNTSYGVEPPLYNDAFRGQLNDAGTVSHSSSAGIGFGGIAFSIFTMTLN